MCLSLVQNKYQQFILYSLAIVTRCPGYLEGGVPALANPCLYISENSSLTGLQYACRQLGLPIHCIRLVPSNTAFGRTTFMLVINKSF